MKITIIAINNFEKNAYQEIFAEFKKRMHYNIDLKELKTKLVKNISQNQIKKEEGAVILKNIDKNSFIIALDEKGKEHSSKDFAALFEKITLGGKSHITFIIGGAYGLDEEVLQNANLRMSLSKLTFPHLMVRIILIEQIYRAQSIIDGHPYHKE